TAHASPAREAFDNRLDLLIAAVHMREGSEIVVAGHFNGKLEGPKIFDRALSLEEIEAVRNGGAGPVEALVAAWNLGALPYALTIADLSPHLLAARLVNNPARAVTGHSWSGRASCFVSDPEQYEAIYFHDDDIEDAGWAADFHWRVPEGLKSGVYAARL